VPSRVEGWCGCCEFGVISEAFFFIHHSIIYLRSIGIRNIKPIVSVKNPGVSNNTPPININIPSNNSNAGSCPCNRLLWAFCMVLFLERVINMFQLLLLK
jgi:hypothetical protein